MLASNKTNSQLKTWETWPHIETWPLCNLQIHVLEIIYTSLADCWDCSRLAEQYTCFTWRCCNLLQVALSYGLIDLLSNEWTLVSICVVMLTLDWHTLADDPCLTQRHGQYEFMYTHRDRLRLFYMNHFSVTIKK